MEMTQAGTMDPNKPIIEDYSAQARGATMGGNIPAPQPFEQVPVVEDNELGTPVLNTAISREAQDAIQKYLGETENLNWAQRASKVLAETASSVGSTLAPVAAAIAEAPYQFGDSLGHVFDKDFGLTEMVRESAGGLGQWAKRQEEESPVAYGISSALAQAAVLNPVANVATSKFINAIFPKGTMVFTGKTSPFLKGLSDAANLTDSSTAGARGVYQAMETFTAGGSGWYRAGNIAKLAAENAATDIAMFGTWGIEQDQATGEYVKKWGAVPSALAFDVGTAGLLGLWQANKLLSRARVALNEDKFHDVRENLKALDGQLAQLGAQAGTPEGNLARDYYIYGAMQGVENPQAKGQFTINLRESLGKVLNRNVDSMDEQQMRELLNWTYESSGSPVQASYAKLTPVSVSDVIEDGAKSGNYAWFDTRSADQVERAREKLRTEKISQYKQKHRGTKEIPENSLKEIQHSVDVEIPEYMGFNPVSKGDQWALPPNEHAPYLVAVKVSRPRDGMGISKGIERQAAMMKAQLQETIKGSYLDGIEKDIPELIGEVSDRTMDMLGNYGRTANTEIKSRSVFSSIRREASYDPILSRGLDVGEMTNNVAKSVQHNVVQAQDGIRKRLVALKGDKAKASEFYAEFGRMYDSAGNVGWDIKPNGLVEISEGKYGMELARTDYNMAKAAEYGYDLEANGWLMPDVQTLLDGPEPALTASTDVIDTLKDLFEVERQITKMRSISQLHGNPELTASPFLHFRGKDIPGDKIVRVAQRSEYGDQALHYAFPNEETAKRFLAQRKQAGDFSWRPELIHGGEEYGQTLGKKFTDYDILRNTAGEHARGYWQGNMTSATEDQLKLVMASQVESATTAARTAVASSMENSLRMLHGAMSPQAYEELRQVVMGIAPKDDTLRKLDSFMEHCFQRLFGYGRADTKALDANDIIHSVPNKNAWTKGKMLKEYTGWLNYAMYSMLNLTGSVNNVLSLIPQMGVTGAWLRKMSMETAEEYAHRVGIRGLAGSDELVKQGLMPRYTIGLRTVKNLTNKEKRNAIWKLAKAEGIDVDQLDDIRRTYEPLGEVSWLKRGAEFFSKPISWTEKASRYASFATWYTYATECMKLPVAQASKWSARMVEESMAAYTPFVRSGATNHQVLQLAMMFKNTAMNMLSKNFDMIANREWRRVFAGNLVNTYLFGAKTAPLIADYQGTHELDDETIGNIQYELGLWGRMPKWLAPSVGRKMEADAGSLLIGVEGSAPVSFAKDLAGSLGQATGGLIQGRGTRYALEELASGLPITAARNALNAMVGYKVSQNHQIVSQAEGTADMVALAIGLQSGKDAMLSNLLAVQRANKARETKARKDFHEELLAKFRDKKVDLGRSMAQMLRHHGGDANAAIVDLLATYSDSLSGRETKLLMDIVKNPAKVDPFTRALFDILISADTEAF